MEFDLLLKKTWKYYIDSLVRLVLMFLVGCILCVTIVLIPTVIMGWARSLLAYIRDGKEPEFNELWSFKNYAQHAALVFVGGLLIAIGFALLILPGLLLATWWMYAAFFIADQKMEFFEALAASKEAVTRTDFWAHVVLVLVLIALNSVATVFSLFTAPFSMVLLTTAYLNIVSSRSLTSKNPA